MTHQSVEAVERLYRVADRLRHRVNYARRHAALMRIRDQWNTVCSSMDVVGDTCQAMRAYFDRPATSGSDKRPAYLLAYGILHALYLQQDAAFWCCKMLGVKPAADYPNPGAWARSVPELDRARNARNDSTGHPVRRDKPKDAPIAAFFIVQHSLTDSGFELMETNEHDWRASFRSVSFPVLIDDQVRVLTAILEGACSSLDDADRQHYERFMHKPLTPILKGLSYPIEKLGANRSVDVILMPGHVGEVEKGLAALKAAIEERGEPFDEMWESEYRKLHRALALLRDYSTAQPGQADHDLADVLGGYVRYSIDHLMQITKEVDDRYAGQGGTAE